LKRSVFSHQQDELARQRALLMTLSEDLTLPLLQIKASVDLLEGRDFAKSAARQYAAQTTLNIAAGLQQIEAYRLLLSSEDLSKLPMEPLAIGALMEDIAHKLAPYAKQYDTEIEVSIQHRLSLVLANPASLVSALEVLSSSLIRAQAAQSDQKSYRLVLGAHTAPDKSIAAGVFSNTHGLSDRTLRAARNLVGRARQPLPAVPAGAAAGVLVADMLCAALWQPLRGAAHDNLAGLATSLPVSKQLKFV
jgi:light-regulated signal transduction histidine kinase (bacteriophytochrome)